MKKTSVFSVYVLMGLLLIACQSNLEPSEPVAESAVPTVVEIQLEETPEAVQTIPATPTPEPTLAPTSTPTEAHTATSQATRTPTPEPQYVSLEWLLTEDEMAAPAERLGIIEVRQFDESPGNYRVCRTHLGISWSVSENVLFHCVFVAAPGYSLDRIVENMFASGQLYEGEVPVETMLDYEDEFVLLAGMNPGSGHSVYDLLRIHNGYLYWSSVTLGTPGGATPESLYEMHHDAIDEFLDDVMMRMIEKSG